MRSLLFVSPHFPPDSAAGTHRARILAPHLAAFGWQPIVLTVEPQSVEGELDEALAAAVAADLHIVRVKAWAHERTRRLGFGDLGLRSYLALRRVAMQLVRSKAVDATLVTTYPTYPALVGAAMKRSFGIPFVLDLQDPWVGAWGSQVGPGGRPDLRSRVSRAVAGVLEGRAATAADALISVTKRTMDDLVARVPAAAGTPQLEVPIGWEPADWDRVRSDAHANVVFDRSDGRIHLCAVGTVLPTAHDAVRAFLEGLQRLARRSDVRQQLRIWFVGTSNQARADAPATVRPLAEAAGVADMVAEHPPRLPYFEALRVLRDAHAVVVLGSGEPHYTPSRVFPALASRRPVIARLHVESPAYQLLSSAAASRRVELIRWSANGADQADALADGLRKILASARTSPATDDAPLTPFSGQALARQVAALLDRVCAS